MERSVSSWTLINKEAVICIYGSNQQVPAYCNNDTDASTILTLGIIAIIAVAVT